MGNAIEKRKEFEKIIEINNEKITCAIVLSERKSIAIKVKENAQVSIYAPNYIDVKYLDIVIEEKKQWIWDNYQKMLLNRLATTSAEGFEVLTNGSRLKFKGKDYNLQIFRLGRKNEIYFDGEFVIAYVKNIDDKEEIKRLVENFYREYAKKVFEEKVREYATKMSLTYGRITIKEQKTRWGSCSSKGNLNFNWKVVKAPEYVIDYLVVHELSHRIEMNHSKRFWKVVEDNLPDYQKGKSWLKVNGKSLF